MLKLYGGVPQWDEALTTIHKSMEITKRFCLKYTDNIHDFVRCQKPILQGGVYSTRIFGFMEPYKSYSFEYCTKLGVKDSKCKAMIGGVDDEAFEMFTEYITSKVPTRIDNFDVALRATKKAREEAGDEDDEEEDDE